MHVEKEAWKWKQRGRRFMEETLRWWMDDNKLQLEGYTGGGVNWYFFSRLLSSDSVHASSSCDDKEASPLLIAAHHVHSLPAAANPESHKLPMTKKKVWQTKAEAGFIEEFSFLKFNMCLNKSAHVWNWYCHWWLFVLSQNIFVMNLRRPLSRFLVIMNHKWGWRNLSQLCVRHNIHAVWLWCGTDISNVQKICQESLHTPNSSLRNNHDELC